MKIIKIEVKNRVKIKGILGVRVGEVGERVGGSTRYIFPPPPL